MPMDQQFIEPKNQFLNAAIYVDYENIYELLQKYRVNPLEIDFFPVILDRYREIYHLNIVECIVYGNFEKKSFQGNHQTILQNLGLQTRHSSRNGKNCSDLMLTVDALTTLYKNPNIQAFVIISSDRDMIPVIGAIKYENKFAYMLSTKCGFNPGVSYYPDQHEYIEDIFHLTPDMLFNKAERRLDMAGPAPLNRDAIEKAKEVSKLFYHSNVWKVYAEAGEPITLKGYISIISKKVRRNDLQILDDFKLAHRYKYVTIYKHEIKGLCLKKGENYREVLTNKNTIG
jgi:uncharacterized LabA/DUF88 family protein